jgi:ABC-type multidrug transport system fused ATPase/permease subunit
MDVLRRLFGFLRPYWRTLTLSVVLLLLRAAVDLVPPLFRGRSLTKPWASGSRSASDC